MSGKSTLLRGQAGPAPSSGELESSIREWGNKIFDGIESAEGPSIFSRKGFYGTMMEWAMRDDDFKTQLFRFVDVLPTLNSGKDIARHLEEYLGAHQERLSPALRLGLKAAGSAPWLLGKGAKSQAAAMARQFMLGDDEREIAAALRKLRERGLRFTVDVLGETVVSESEAEAFVAHYERLIRSLAKSIQDWPAANGGDPARDPVLNVSLKLSAFYSQIHPADPDTASRIIADRLKPILRLCRQVNAFVNFDMESYALKDLTLRIYQEIFADPEFASGPLNGIALQAYLIDCEQDLENLRQWAVRLSRRLTVRLVKGAYWDYETIIAQQRHWPVPVFQDKAATDANFEKLSAWLLRERDTFDAAFATHNVRSIANVLAHAEHLGLSPDDYEFQMIYGMAEPIKEALLQLGHSVREYCPVGDLLPGMAYFVRRLLENTSNEGFLANKFSKGASREALLANPADTTAAPRPAAVTAPGKPDSFANEPLLDFRLAHNRDRIRTALGRWRSELGRRYPLVINHAEVPTQDWLPSLNPGNQEEIIGYAAQGTISDAEAALSAARTAQPGWARLGTTARADLLRRTADLMRRDHAQLCALEILEAGKNWAEADADVAEAIDFCDFYAHCIETHYAAQRTQAVAGELNLQEWWPLGVGLVVAPWNFPLAILTGMTAAALVCGNTVIMKPSDQTPVIGAALMRLFIEAGLPKGVVNLLMGPGSKVGAHLVEHPNVDFIAFTGSKEVGLRIWQAAGVPRPGQTRLRKVVCEMGGKNALIVDSDADLDEAVSGCIQSAFGYQGQKCSALSRLILLAEIRDRFLERLTAAAEAMRVGPAEVPGNLLGPVINRESQQRILQMIAHGQKEARLVWQGRVPDSPQACYVPPTIFADVPATSRLFREEIFGPVLAVSAASSFDEALALANDSEFALTGGIYSRSPNNINRARAELVCGNLYINRPITGAIVGRQPFGGFKMSGGGTKAGGPEYLQHFMVPRVMTENCLRRGFAPAEVSVTPQRQ